MWSTDMAASHRRFRPGACRFAIGWRRIRNLASAPVIPGQIPIPGQILQPRSAGGQFLVAVPHGYTIRPATAPPASIGMKKEVGASVARRPRTPPDAAKTSGLQIGISNRLRGLSNRSIVVICNYCSGPITAEPCRAKARPLHPRRSYFAPVSGNSGQRPAAGRMVRLQLPDHWLLTTVP